MITSVVGSLAKRLRHRISYDRADIVPATIRFGRFVVRRGRVAAHNARLNAAGGDIEHFGVHMPRNNAGDTVLFDAVERLFDQEIQPFDWRLTQLREMVTKSDVARINEKAKGILVGGGGLFIADTNPNNESGWQWKIAKDDLEALKPPLILFGVGYNQFRGANGFPPVFGGHVTSTVEKARFIGLRNHGSIAGLKKHLPEGLHGKLTYQPCMTTVLNRYYPAAMHEVERPAKTIALNLAFDRRSERFGLEEEAILGRIATALKTLTEKGFKFVAAVHAWDDDPMIEFLHREGITAEYKRLNLDSPEEIVKFYKSMPLTIGMRGHAQMIPFGCGNAIFSIISHPKLAYFLEDVGHPEWGADVHDEDLAERIVSFVKGFEGAESGIRASIAAKQEEIWAITRANLGQIGSFLQD